MHDFDESLNVDLSTFHKYVETEELLETEIRNRPATKKKPPSKIREIIIFLLPIIAAALIAFGLRSFVFINANVPTGSMENTIMTGEKLIASRLSYLKKEPERFDIVVFKFPDDEKEVYIKRIIGLPGEKVEIIDGKVYINDSTQPLRDDFVTAEKPEGDYGPFYVPKGYYFMMGDNRNNSLDSRFWFNKYVAQDKILGKAEFIYYPSVKKLS